MSARERGIGGGSGGGEKVTKRHGHSWRLINTADRLGSPLFGVRYRRAFLASVNRSLEPKPVSLRWA